MRTVALLTLDHGSVLYNPSQIPDEVVLKHTDGELVKTERKSEGTWPVKRRDELEVNFWSDGTYSTPSVALATLADRQAFGFRVNGEAVNPLVVDGSKDPETLEIEPLSFGAVLIEGEQQLPLAVFTTDEVYYRIYVDSRAEGDAYPRCVLEKRNGPRGGWDEVSESEPTEPGDLLEDIADRTGMEAVVGDASDIESCIEDQQEVFTASRTEEDDEIREQMAIQNKTAFDPSVPRPRPVDFPDL